MSSEFRVKTELKLLRIIEIIVLLRAPNSNTPNCIYWR